VILFLAAITFGLFSRSWGGRLAVVPSWAKGGGRRDSGNGDRGCWLFLQWDDEGGSGLRDTEALGEGREGAGGGIAEGTQCREQARAGGRGSTGWLSLEHAEQASLDRPGACRS